MCNTFNVKWYSGIELKTQVFQLIWCSGAGFEPATSGEQGGDSFNRR